MTSVLQPLDVSINKPFKGYLQEQYEKWFCERNRELTPTGKVKCAAPHIVANWVSAAWKWIEGPNHSRNAAFQVLWMAAKMTYSGTTPRMMGKVEITQHQHPLGITVMIVNMMSNA
jgi:DDE superfamily endonuclease.